MRIGSLDSSGGERISEVQHLLNHVAPTTITDNIIGFLWSKQIWGDFYVANALGTSNSIDMLHNEKYHPIILALFKEGATVALASGVKPEALPEHCFDPIALMDVSADAVGPYFQKMGDSFVGHVKVFSGPWRDIAIRKRPTEVDHILGFIVAKGKEYGAPTPLTTRLIELVKEVERGQRPQDDANLLDLNSLL
jgi:2-dehydropantoate 2-reductase